MNCKTTNHNRDTYEQSTQRYIHCKLTVWHTVRLLQFI